MDMNIITYDIEEWFHCDFISGNEGWDNYEVRIHKNTDVVLETMNKYNRKGTFFILGWIADKYPEVVKKIHSEGHELACHSMYHELVHTLTPQKFKEDTQKALSIIEDIVGEKIFMYRAPGFSITEATPWAFDILAELGITYDASVFPAAHDYGGFPSFGVPEPAKIITNGAVIKEFPMNIQQVYGKSIVFSGGGFFRFFPYRYIKKWTKESSYVMGYHHPRDFDANQPVLQHLPMMRKFKSYYGVKGAHKKFEQWLSDFETMSILEASALIDWNKAKSINIHELVQKG